MGYILNMKKLTDLQRHRNRQLEDVMEEKAKFSIVKQKTSKHNLMQNA